MTFNLHTFYCRRCQTGTPHELDERGKPHCITCTEKDQQRQSAQSWPPQQTGTVAQHLAALDGMPHRNRVFKQKPAGLEKRGPTGGTEA